MVFYVAPKRHKPTRGSDEKATLLSLPDELLLQVFIYVDRQDVLFLRRTCSSVVPACNSVLQSRLKTLYIHPKNIHTAIKVCEHPAFSQEIDEIVLLGRVDWKKFGQIFPREAILPSTFMTFDRALGYDRVGPATSKIDRWAGFRGWPPALSNDGKGLACVRDPMPTTFSEAYWPLLEALQKLPQLKKLGFAESIQRKGFNQISKDNIETHANKMAARPHISPPIQTQQKTKFDDKSREELGYPSDIDVLYGILVHSSVSFESLGHNAELPWGEHMLSSTLELLWKGMESITTLEIALDCAWHHSRSTRFYEHIFELAINLRCLKITLLPGSPLNPSRNYLRMLLAFLKCAKISLLEICQQSQSRIATSKRSQRPELQAFDMASFLSENTQLSSIKIKNVIFESYVGNLNSSWSPKHYTRSVLSAMEGLPVLEHASWLVNYYHHDPRCKLPDSANLSCSKHKCGMYTRYDTLQDFQDLATSLGAELDEETLAWDFGQAVMKQHGSQ